jgi:hypothetical protein
VHFVHQISFRIPKLDGISLFAVETGRRRGGEVDLKIDGKDGTPPFAESGCVRNDFLASTLSSSSIHS